MHIQTITFALTFFILEHILMLLIYHQAPMASFPRKSHHHHSHLFTGQCCDRVTNEIFKNINRTRTRLLSNEEDETRHLSRPVFVICQFAALLIIRSVASFFLFSSVSLITFVIFLFKSFKSSLSLFLISLFLQMFL